MADVPLEERPYSRSDLQADPTFPPLRGPLCPHCGMRIPQFAELTEHSRTRVVELINQGRMINAILELRVATGCPLGFANLWVVHRGLAVAPPGEEPTPCPYCGKALRTARAKQCRHCKRDWHDPDR